MNVVEINIGPSEALAQVESVAALAGKGLKGDRQFFEQGAEPGDALTLIEAEALEDVGLTGAQSRRQVVVRGVRLNDLIGKRFRVGDVECFGVKLCEPGPGLLGPILAVPRMRPSSTATTACAGGASTQMPRACSAVISGS